MKAGHTSAQREEAVQRASHHAPFLRAAINRWPEVTEAFVAAGAERACALALQVPEEIVERRLRLQRDRLALAVALGDLSGELLLERVTDWLSDFADGAIEAAVSHAIAERCPGEEPRGLSVIAMGKLGSHELNYSSDVDLLLLFNPAILPRRARDDAGEAAVRIGRRVVELLQQRTPDGYVARVDLRLRPSPEVTPIVLPVDAAISHYESSALPWERAAFIRARVAAGDRILGHHFLTAIEPFIWRRSLDFGVIDEVRQISDRIRDHYIRGAHIGPGFDLKRGGGGIRQIEFFAQIRQMIHGGRDPSVRSPATLDAIEALRRGDYLNAADAEALSAAYRLLRTVEHRVQMVDDQQTHLLPLDTDDLDNVARLHGVADGAALLQSLAPGVERAGALFDTLAGEERPRLAREETALAKELRDLGFADPGEPARHVASWRTSRARSLRSPAAQAAFEAMLPGLLSAIAEGSSPTNALNRLSDIIERLSAGVNLFRLLEAQPQLAQLFAKILAHAPALADQLGRRPELLEGMFDASSFEMPDSAQDFSDRLSGAMRTHSYDLALDRARRLVNERRFALGVQLIDRRRDPLQVASGYACVAEGALNALASAAVAEFEEAHGRFAEGELVVLGLGRLGGCALTHASDLDIIYLHTALAGALSDGARPLGPNDYFNRLASRVTAALSVPTAAGPLYEVDTRLRPEGAQGMLAVSLESFGQYQRTEAWTWEHMALCRARPVFGSEVAQSEAAAVVESVLRVDRDRQKVVSDAAKMRAEMARHKPPLSALDVKLGPGGLVDLEFAVHVLQLTTHVGLTPDLDRALEQLAAETLVSTNIVEAQRLLTRMLVMMRLVAPSDVKPTEATWQLVAEACGAGSWDALLAEHDAARQSIASLWQQIVQGI